MSPAEIRHRALLAAAKVTLSLAALGCGAADPLPSLATDQRSSESPCEQGGKRCDTGAAGAAGAAPEEQAGGAPPGVGGASPGVGGVGGQVATAGAGQGGGLGCGENTEFPYDAVQVNCCLDVVKKTFPQDPGALPPETLSAEELACCRVVLTSRDQQGEAPIAGVDPIPWNLAYACCLFTDPSDGSFSPTCTPWGPPMPPAMIEGLLEDLSWLREVA